MRSADSSARHIGSREIFLIVLCWTSLAVLSSVNRILDPRDFGTMRVITPVGPIILTFLEAWVWAAFTPLIFWLSSRFSPNRSNWVTRIPLLLGAGAVISMTIYVILAVARSEILPSPRRRIQGAFAPLRELGRFPYLNQLLIYFVLLVGGLAREYFLRDQQRAREATQLEANTAHLQAQLAEARLDALRMQINPHFLFNTLNAVSALVERDPSGVRRMIARLSELLRHTIDSHGTDEVPVRAELDFLRRYLEIMEIRFQGALRVDTNIDPDVLEALVPNLILQPIVENALEHGVTRRADGPGHVEIAAHRSGDRLILTVRDNGPGLQENEMSEEGRGVGLRNTRARLQQLYGDAATFRLAAAPSGGGTVAEIALPLHTSSDLRVQAVTSEERGGDG
jgi:two-component system LytT family sensor kinase